MSELDARHFNLGETLQGKDDDGRFINLEVLGSVVRMPAPSEDGPRGKKQRATGREIVAVAIRNVSGAPVLPGQVVRAARIVPLDGPANGCR